MSALDQFPFPIDADTVLQVLLERAEQLRAEGDRILQVEIDRAMWVVAAHQNQSQETPTPANVPSDG